MRPWNMCPDSMWRRRCLMALFGLSSFVLCWFSTWGGAFIILLSGHMCIRWTSLTNLGVMFWLFIHVWSACASEFITTSLYFSAPDIQVYMQQCAKCFSSQSQKVDLDVITHKTNQGNYTTHRQYVKLKANGGKKHECKHMSVVIGQDHGTTSSSFVTCTI